jgi:hypothetical protein
LPTIVVPAVVSAAEDELHIFYPCEPGQSQPRAESAVADRRFRAEFAKERATLAGRAISSYFAIGVTRNDGHCFPVLPNVRMTIRHF